MYHHVDVWFILLSIYFYEINTMARTQQPLLPGLLRIAQAFGLRLQMARMRRKLSASLFAERIGVSRNTLRRVEEGDPSVSLGTYIRALRALGLEEDLNLLAKDDDLGRKLQDKESLTAAHKLTGIRVVSGSRLPKPEVGGNALTQLKGYAGVVVARRKREDR